MSKNNVVKKDWKVLEASSGFKNRMSRVFEILNEFWAVGERYAERQCREKSLVGVGTGSWIRNPVKVGERNLEQILSRG